MINCLRKIVYSSIYNNQYRITFFDIETSVIALQIY